MFKHKSNATFNNSVFTKQRIEPMHEVTERLYLAVKALKGIEGQSNIGRLFNESPQNMTNWEKRGMSKAGVLKATELLGVSSTWLQSGIGPMTVTGEDVVIEGAPGPFEDAVRIPLLANCASMGNGNDSMDADYVVGDLALSPHWINQYIKPTSIRELKFIHAHGESMAPTFSDGDVLLVDVGARDPSSHEGVYVLEVHGKVYVKRVRMRMSGTLEVSSDNPTIKTVDELNGDHEVRVLGRVVWAWNGKKL